MNKYQVDTTSGSSVLPYQYAKDSYPVGKGEYIGVGKGLNGEVVARVKVNIESIEIIDEAETVGIGELAMKYLPKDMIKQNTVNVDAVTGATVTSNAIKQAVSQAIEEALLHTTKRGYNIKRPVIAKAWKDMTDEEKTQVIASEIHGHKRH